ncbi:MAG: GH116 family glycosyl-hydrolase, partial [Candidatus Sumerlaeota bacterium]|nr:GH116 family glycosyl-hydrolase [Candidatus Sumerlaeota bacterium]
MGFNKILFIAFFFCITISALSQFDTDTGIIRSVRWANGVPLGGIGCGKIELLTDGSFANATIYNNWDRRTGFLKGSFFAVFYDDGTTKVARMLRLAPNCADPNIADVERIHKQRLGLPDYSEYEGVENIAGTEYTGSFPFATIQFEDRALPIRITLDAFSPLIPHDIENSSLPVAFLSFTLDNRTEKTVRTSLLVSQEKWRLLRHGSSLLKKLSGLNGLVFREFLRDNNPPGYTDYFFIGSNEVDDTMKRIFVDFAEPEKVIPWDYFRRSGMSYERFSFGDKDSRAPTDDFVVRKVLEPGQKVTIHFILAWRAKDCITTYIKKTPTSQLVDSDSGTTAVWDQNPATRWSTGRPMRSGDAFEVDLGNPQTVSRIILKSRMAPQEYPRGCAILSSPDGLNWTTVLSLDQRMCYMRQREGEIEFYLANITMRFLKM